MNRRIMLQSIGVGVAALLGGVTETRIDQAVHERLLRAGPVGEMRILPGDGNTLALTVDDGVSPEAVAAFADFCRDSGTRLTFFVNGKNKSWTINAPKLRPMVDSGQIQLANHTWSHPDVTTLDEIAVAYQIAHNDEFLRNTYGVDGRPYFRPPYGHHNTQTDRIALDLGYQTIALWTSSLEDYQPVAKRELVARAERGFKAQHVVLAHANVPPITHCYGELLDIIKSRGLRTVTLNDAFGLSQAESAYASV